MKYILKNLALLVTLLYLAQSTCAAPTNATSETSDDEIDSCKELKELEVCLSGDDECLNERRLKRQTICAEKPQCSICAEYNSESVQPEVVATISPSLSEVPAELRIERNIVIENDNETQYYRGYIEPSSNITTIIRLTNMINNTNIVNIPTTLNNTNVNNIHIFNNQSSEEGGKFGLGYTEEGPCCWSQKPATCKTTTSGTKCRHNRARVCGKQCTKKIINRRKNPCHQIPQWPYMMCPPPPGQYPQYYPPQYNPFPQFDDEFDDDDDFPLFPDDEELKSKDSGWIVAQEKCKIVSEDGLQITNCTDKNVEFDHPFARNSLDESGKRVPRHSNNHFDGNYQQPYMAQQYQPYVPIYIQPIPIYMPQYYMPPPPQMNSYYYPQQMPVPPIDTDQYYSEPELEHENPYRKSRKHSKKNLIIFEHDGEL